jgi:hypothetical protein
MQLILPIILLVLCSCFHKTQTVESAKTSYFSQECSNLYPFQGYYVDLDNMNALLIDGIPAKDFKNCSKYSHRFSGNQISDSVTVGDRSFVLNINSQNKKYEMKITESTKKDIVIPLPVASPLPDVHMYSAGLIPFGDEVILILEDMYTTHYSIFKYSKTGEMLMQTQIEHTYVTHPEPDTDYHHRYVYLQYITSSQIVFSSNIYFTEKLQTVVLSMEDFSTKVYGKASCGVILDEEESILAGFISEEGKNNYNINLKSGKEISFTLQYGESYFETLLHGNLLFFSNYHPIASGATLYCYDLIEEKLVWTGDVKQPMVSHSEYYNKVTLSMYMDKIIMEGNEASCNYLQIFDAKTGKRLAYFSDLE